MKNMPKPNTDETPSMIITGIIVMYILIVGFIFYLYFLHRITIMPALITAFIFTIIYLPRFLIIQKLAQKDDIKIIDNYIMINGTGIEFSDIKDFSVKQAKPSVIFFINNKMIVFNQAKFQLHMKNETISFNAIGSEKIKLLQEFLNNIVN